MRKYDWQHDDKIKEIIKNYIKEGKSYHEIAEIIDSTLDAVEGACRRYSLRKGICTIPIIKNYNFAKKTKLSSNQIMDFEKYIPILNDMRKKWIIPVSNIAPNKKSFKTWLVWADSHIPYQNNEVIKILLKICEDIKFDGMTILGDFLDFDCISHWNKNKPQRIEGKRLTKDYAEGNIILDEFDKRLPLHCNKKFFYGNHERFYYDLIEGQPALEGLGSPTSNLKLIERGYKVFDTINYIDKLGKLSLTHGMYTGDTAVKKHVQAFMTNVLFAHVHSQAEFCAPSPAKEISTYGASIGCTCNMNPEYMQNQPHKWTHGFAIVYIYDNEYFDVDLKRIVNGKVIYNNKLYDGNKK